MKTLLCALLLLCAGCTAAYRQPLPADHPVALVDYDKWRNYDFARTNTDGGVNSYAAKLERMVARGYFKAYAQLQHEEPPTWWVFFVPPGTYEEPVCRLETTAGTYTSIRVFFTPLLQTTEPYETWPFEADASRCEAVPNGTGGALRVVAYVRFPEEPRGELLKWEVVP